MPSHLLADFPSGRKIVIQLSMAVKVTSYLGLLLSSFTTTAIHFEPFVSSIYAGFFAGDGSSQRPKSLVED
jgi:hypothetical protein